MKYCLKKLFILLLFVLTITSCTASRQQTNKTIKQSNKYSASLQIDFGDGRIITNYELKITNSKNLYLWPAMKQVLVENDVYLDYKDYGGNLGVFITQIGDKKNGEDGKYWQYFINGKYANVGASNYKLQKGDIIKWRFINSIKK